MKESKLKNWDDYEKAIRELTLLRDKRKSELKTYFSPMLYRGQSDSKWRLETTLERYSPRSLKCTDYYSVIHGAKYGIESITEKEWKIITPPEYDGWLKTQDAFGLTDLPAYDYMVYLRHHGFPSPLLDWTRSPYIAAYFAFQNISYASESVSIYVYQEYLGEAKVGRRGDSRITGCGPYVRSHKRHVLQQSEYTICTKIINGEWNYTTHEDVLANKEEKQDYVWKFIIPSSERNKVLRILDRNNINAYSLFSSEESLVNTMAFREFTSRFGAL